MMHSLISKAEAQLDEARNAEEKALNDFQKLKQTLENTMRYGAGDIAAAKQDLAAAEETKGTAEGDLAVTKADLAEDNKILGETHHDCMEKADTFETEVASTDEELKALATAKKIIIEATSLAQTQPESFLQVSVTDSLSAKAMRMVRSLGEKH